MPIAYSITGSSSSSSVTNLSDVSSLASVPSPSTSPSHSSTSSPSSPPARLSPDSAYSSSLKLHAYGPTISGLSPRIVSLGTSESTSTATGTSKTDSFFGSPFSTRESSPVPPPPPTSVSRPAGLDMTSKHDSSSKTRAVSGEAPCSAEFFPQSLPKIEVRYPTETSVAHGEQFATLDSKLLASPPARPPLPLGFATGDDDLLRRWPTRRGSELRSLPSPSQSWSDIDRTPRVDPFRPAYAAVPHPAPAPHRLHHDRLPTAPPSASFDDELHVGQIITNDGVPSFSSKPCSELSSIDILMPEESCTRLRLLKPLGQGTFSSVWLAEDLSEVALHVRRKRSLREVKRRRSQRDHDKRAKARANRDSYADSAPISRHVSDSARPFSTRSPHLSINASINFDSLNYSTKHVPGITPSHFARSKDTPISVRPGEGDYRHRHRTSEDSVHLDERDGDMPCPTLPDTSMSSSGLTASFLNASRSYSAIVDFDNVPLLQDTLTRKARHPSSTKSRLVAVKATSRGIFDHHGHHSRIHAGEEDMDRTRVSFIREVEVLRHISHPNITPLLSYLSTAHHHVLVLPYCSGGDLLYLVNDDHSWSSMSELIVRRIFTELAKAVGWMHGVGLVHRDIKLENILLTTPIALVYRNSSRAPLVQLTDFGLSRFIDPESPFLTTKCGSEAYAAPELIASAYGDGYDARLTDAWACGVVLYALACRQLPFGEGPEDTSSEGYPGSSRRKWLMRIANAEWEWQVMQTDKKPSSGLCGVVERLLVRDARRRMRIGSVEFWECEWFEGEETALHLQRNHTSASDVPTTPDEHTGAESPTGYFPSPRQWSLPVEAEASPQQQHTSESFSAACMRLSFSADEDADNEADEEGDSNDGLLVVTPGVNSIARQEVVQ